MKILRYIIWVIFGTILLSLCWRGCSQKPIVIVDTIVKEVKVEQPIVRESTIIAYKVVRLPTAPRVDTICVQDTVVDSVFVEIPIEQKVYSDSGYTAWVSGYQPRLDSIHFISHNKVVSFHNRLDDNCSKRLLLGIQVGYGITPRGLQPYLGLGVSYKFGF